MGLREAINQKKGLVTAVAVVLIIVAIGMAVMQFTGGTTEDLTPKALFTSDDGKTFFQDDATKLPPFDHQGKQAVAAWVYTCDDGKTTFVGYMQRYTPETLAKLNAARGTPTYDQAIDEANVQGAEVKRPGDANWVTRGTPEASAVMRPACPDGKGTLQQVY